MDWATQGRTTASIGAARRREDRLGKIPPQPSLFDQRNRGTPRNIQDRSRTHFKDLSTQHPGVPYFADLAVKEKAYWDSGVWIPDAGLKQDTSIEETLFALTGVPALARLGVSGARAAVGSGRQALANRGIGGWTKVMDPGRREFLKATGAAAVSAATPPKILLDFLESTAIPAKVAGGTGGLQAAAIATYKRIGRETTKHGEFLEGMTPLGMNKDFFIKEISRKGATRKEIQTATKQYKKGLQESQRQWKKEAKVWTDKGKELIDVRGDLPHTTLPLAPPGTPGRLRYPDGKRVPHVPGGPLSQPGDFGGAGRITFRQQRRVGDTIGRTEELADLFKDEAIGMTELMREIPTLRRTARESLRDQRTLEAVSRLTPGTSRTSRPGTTMTRPRHGGGTVSIKAGYTWPSPANPRPGRRSRTRRQRAVEEYQEALKNRNRR